MTVWAAITCPAACPTREGELLPMAQDVSARGRRYLTEGRFGWRGGDYKHLRGEMGVTVNSFGGSME